MELTRRNLRSLVLAAAFVSASAASLGEPLAATPEQPEAVVVAQAPEPPPPRELQPRYEPAPIEQKSWYNDSYIFGMTRGVADSTMVPAVKAPLFLLTVPLDLVLLPFAAIGGLFG